MSDFRTTNIPPRRLIESHTVYVAVNTRDPSDRFQVIADTERHAKIELLDKLGFVIELRVNDERWVLSDVETGELKAVLTSKTMDAALDEVLRAAQWRVQEPTEMIGGSLGTGFGEIDD